MFHHREHDLGVLGGHLHQASELNANLMAEVLEAACRRFPSLGQSEKTARIEQLVRSSAWTDASLALIELELPSWQLRRLAYDDGEWYCALSRLRELPDWLDQCTEGRHADLPLAILSAFVEARRSSTEQSRASVPTVRRSASASYDAVCSGHFA